MENRLYVGNLPFSATDEQIRSLFAQAGEVTSAKIVNDRDTGRSRGFAFVEMANNNDALKAIKMFNAYRFDSRELVVNIARPREERSGGGGGNRGYNDRRDYNRNRY